MVLTTTFGADEFQHLHLSWSIFKGMVPYKDYVDNHTPWLHFLLTPFFLVFSKVDIDSSQAISFMTFARIFSYCISLVSFLVLYNVGKKWMNWKVGLLAALFLANNFMFMEKSVELRPDVESTLLLLLFLNFYIEGFKRGRKYLFISGILIGSGVMFTQKLLFLFPGILVIQLVYLYYSFRLKKSKEEILNIVVLWIAALIPFLLTSGYFLYNNAFNEFFYYCFTINVKWQHRFSPLIFITKLISQNPLLVLFSILGAIKLIWHEISGMERNSTELIIYILTLSLIGGLFYIPSPHPQYFMMLIVLLSLCAAETTLWLVDLIAARFKSYRKLIISTVVLISLHPLCRYSFIYCNIEKSPQRIRQERIVSYIINNSSPSDTTLDGFPNYSVFRPHAYKYYCMLHSLRPMVKESEVRELVDGIKSGVIAPKFIFFDVFVQMYSEELNKYILQNYKETPIKTLFTRNDHDGK
jgi:hypothetical protein